MNLRNSGAEFEITTHCCRYKNAGLGSDRLYGYLHRFPKDMPFELIEIPAGKRGKNADIKRILEKEGELMLAAVGKGNRIVTLIYPVRSGIPQNLLTNLKIGNKMVAMLACSSVALKDLHLLVKKPPCKVGHYLH